MYAPVEDAIAAAEREAAGEVAAVERMAGPPGESPGGVAAAVPVPAPGPLARGNGTYVLPASLKRLDLSGVALRREDTGCRACGGALFGRVDVVRMPVGYRSGQRRGELLFCLACGEVLNAQELAEW